MKTRLQQTESRRKFDPQDLLNAPVTFVDVWLAENPGSKDEEEENKALDMTIQKRASMAPAGALVAGFEKEAAEIAQALEECGGDLEEFERRYANHDFFADCPTVPLDIQFRREFRGSVEPSRFSADAESVTIFKKGSYTPPKYDFKSTTPRRSAALDDGTD